MTTLTSAGAVNLTTSTNWSPAQIPVAGDDLVIAGAHTLTLDADLVLNSITLSHVSARFAISGTVRSVEATNGFTLTAAISALITAAIPTGTSLTLTGRWSGAVNLISIATSTGGNLTLQTVGASPSDVLFSSATQIRTISSNWAGGTLTTIGRFDLGANGANSNTMITIAGGTWSHTSIGMNTFGANNNILVNASGSSTVNWTGSIDSQFNGGNSNLISLTSTSNTHSIGTTGDTFLHRNSASNGTRFINVTSGTLEVVGKLGSRLDSVTLLQSGGTLRWRDQSQSIDATDYVFIQTTGGTIDMSGLVLTNYGKFCLLEIFSGSTTTTAGTSVTNATSSATACAIGTTAFDGKIITLESDPPTLPSVSAVASGTTYGYSGSPLTGTGIINDPATIAAAMITSFGSLPTVMVKTTIATLESQTSFTLTAGSPDDNAYNGQTVIVTDGSTSAQKAVGVVLDYDGLTKTVTLAADPAIFTMAAGDSVYVIAGASSGGVGGDTAGVTELLTRIPDATPGTEGGLPVLSEDLTVTVELDPAVETQIDNIENASGYLLAVLAGACADPQTASETYAITVFGSTFTVDMAGQTSTGIRTAPTLTKA